jgi:hypothetical protein
MTMTALGTSTLTSLWWSNQNLQVIALEPRHHFFSALTAHAANQSANPGTPSRQMAVHFSAAFITASPILQSPGRHMPAALNRLLLQKR